MAKRRNPRIEHPKVLYVVMESDGENLFPVSHTSLEEMLDDLKGERVGIYELRDVRTLQVTRELI